MSLDAYLPRAFAALSRTILVTFLSLSNWAAAADVEPLSVGQTRQLFFDDASLASQTGVKRVWHQPEKMSAPVLRRERSWEGLGPYLYGTVLRDSKSDAFRLWYNCYVGGRPDYFTCYAVSQDGVDWNRPACDAVSDARLPAGNNVVMLGSGLPNYRQCLSPTVFHRPEEPDPARRYAMVYWDINAGRTVQFVGLCLAYSPDGIHWTNHPENPIFPGASDVADACYDPVHRRYLLHYKIWRVEGDVIASQTPRGKIGNVSHWPTWDAEPLEGGKVRFVGHVVDFASKDTSPMRGTVDFAREPKHRRVAARAESRDLIHWTDARLVFELPETGDPAGLSTYGMSVYPFEGQYVGLLRVFHNDREIDLELAHSRDDLAWRRVNPRQPFLPLGTGGSFDGGMVFSSNSLISVGDELWFYYGAFTGHHGVAEKDQSASIGLAKMRRDGFVSFASDDDAGEIVTVPIRCEGDRLVINAAAHGGAILVEIRDQNGRPQPGFTFGDCDPFEGDAVSHPVSWRGTKDVRRFVRTTIRLAFRLKKAHLYSYQLPATVP
jgi:hypothetical protein